jgi:hypothetical protein
LLDAQVNGTSQLAVTSNGTLQLNGSNVTIRNNGNYLELVATNGTYFQSSTVAIDNSALGLASNAILGFTAGNGGETKDTILRRDAANTLAQRNGTAAQTSRVYNTFTDASNYERLSTTWSSNVCYTKPENAGTGSARLYVPVTGATTVSGLPAAATAGAGARAFVTDATLTVFLSTVAGGGANKVPVVSDGTNWLIG